MFTEWRLFGYSVAKTAPVGVYAPPLEVVLPRAAGDSAQVRRRNKNTN